MYGFKEKFGSRTMKIFDSFTTKGNYTCNIRRSTECTASQT